jgi:hypothetical protein
MIRRYIIWLNNHAYDKRLPHVPDLSIIVHGRLWARLDASRPPFTVRVRLWPPRRNTSSMLARPVTAGLNFVSPNA